MEKQLVEIKESYFNQNLFIDYILSEDITTISNFLGFDLAENPMTIDEDDIIERLEELSEDELEKWWDIYLKDKEMTLEKDIKDTLSLAISDDYLYNILDKYIDYIKEDVMISSDYEDGDYNIDDIRLAIGRVFSR